MALGCVEFAIPGRTLEEKLGVLESHGMWLELVNDGLDEKRLENVLETLPSFDTPILSVQAYLLHDLRMLNAKEKDREIAIHHVEKTIEIASDVGAENVVTIVIYGEPAIENPRRECIEIFKRFGELGEESNVTISIEPLGKEKTVFLPSADEVYRLVQDVNSDHVRLMIDTMHVHDNGENVAEIVRKYVAEIMELQLRDTNSRPPGQGEINFDPVLEIVRKRFKGLACLEYRPSSDPWTDFENALKTTKIIAEVR